jgi:hypothetical protein
LLARSKQVDYSFSHRGSNNEAICALSMARKTANAQKIKNKYICNKLYSCAQLFQEQIFDHFNDIFKAFNIKLNVGTIEITLSLTFP